MNVLYLLNYAGHGGTEHYVQLLIDKFKNKDVRTFFVWNVSGKLSKKIQAEKIPSMQLIMKHPFDLRAAYKLAKYCKKNHIAVVHTSFLRENYIAILSKIFNPKVRIVYTNHVMLHNNVVLKIMNRVMTFFNHSIIAVCHLGKDILVSNGVSKDKITVIHNGIDSHEWELEEQNTIRKELGIDQDTYIISCLSRFDEFKGNRFLIESIAAFKEKNIKDKYIFLLADRKSVV